METAVIYARYSSNHQREESIEGQLRECEAFAERNDFKIIGSYIDRAQSAKTDARPQFQKMILDSAKGAFNYVIVYQLDRFSRNRYDSAIYKAKLKRNGVRLLSAKENITPDPAGIILESVLEGMAEYYSAELAQKVKRGMTENALAGRWAGGTVPLGYKLNSDKHLEINPDEAPIIREIFERFANGQQAATIADWLNSIHFKTRSGGHFNRSSFHRMLANKVYFGCFHWGKVLLPNTVPPIITKDLFDIVQARISRQKIKGASSMKSNLYILTTKIFCGCCNGPMVGVSGTSRHGVKHYYYACQNKRTKKTSCNTGYLNRDEIENTIVEKAQKILGNPDNINIIAEQIIKLNKSEENVELKILQKRENELKKKLDNFAQAIENGLLSSTIAQKLQQYEAELQEIQLSIKKEQLLHNPNLLSKEHIAFFLTRFKSMPEAKAKAYILDTLLNAVSVEKQNNGDFVVTVVYNFHQSPKLPNQEIFTLKQDENGPGVRNCSSWWTSGELLRIVNDKLVVKFIFPHTA